MSCGQYSHGAGRVSEADSATAAQQQLTIRSLAEAASKLTGSSSGSHPMATMSALANRSVASNSVGLINGHFAAAVQQQQAAIEQQNRMKGWILDQEYYSEQNRLNGGRQQQMASSAAQNSSPVASIGQISPADHDSEDSNQSKRKNGRDPLSHRIIEKRRRDRMNCCLNDLQRLIPPAYLKKGKGRTEKTEIVEMAIKHLKYLESHSKVGYGATVGETMSTPCHEEDKKKHFKLGYQECVSEAIRFLVEFEGLFAGDGLCLRMVNHLHKHADMTEACPRHSKGPNGLSSLPGSNFGGGLPGGSVDTKVGLKVKVVLDDEREPMDVVEESTNTMLSVDTRSNRSSSKATTVESSNSHRESPLLATSGPFGGSQLRKMLEAKELNSSKCSAAGASPLMALSPAMSESKLAPSPLPGSPCPFSSSENGTNGSSRKNYKKEIKERFQATLSNSSMSNEKSSTSDNSTNSLPGVATTASSVPLVSSSSTLESIANNRFEDRDKSATHLSKFRSMSSRCATIGCPVSCSCHRDQQTQQQQPPGLNCSLVPGFALHSTGAFYVPVRLEPSVVRRFCGELRSGPNGSSAFPPVLHPISIAVSFAHGMPGGGSGLAWPGLPNMTTTTAATAAAASLVAQPMLSNGSNLLFA